MFQSLTKYIIEDGFKDSCVLNILQNLQKISMTEFTVKQVTICRVATFLNEALRQIKFLRNLRNIKKKLTVQIWTATCGFNKE